MTVLRYTLGGVLFVMACVGVAVVIDAFRQSGRAR